MKLDANLRLLFWETTAGCNLACIHCRRIDVATQMMKDDLTLAESFRFIDDLASLGPSILVLSGGEPLVRKDIFDIAQYASWRGLTVALATNGTLIDKAIARQIRQSGIHRVAISIDGANATTHDDFRKQPGSLAGALRGLKLCGDQGLSLQINCTVTKHNVHQLDQLYQLALDHGVDAFHLFMLVPVGCGMSIADSHMLSAEKYEEVLNWIYDRSQEEKMFVKATCAPHYFRVVNQRKRMAGPVGAGTSETPKGPLGDPRPATPHPSPYSTSTRGCLAGTSICFVSHKGEVFPCGYLPVTAGNIREKSFVEIWKNSPVWTGLRDTDQLGGKCGACEFKNICLGCRARAYYEGGDYLAEEPYCIYKPVKLRRQQEVHR